MAQQEIMYQSTEGHQWTGRGRKPQWVIDYIISGKNMDDIRVGAPKQRKEATKAPPSKNVTRDPWIITGRFKTKLDLVRWMKSHGYQKYANYFRHAGDYYLSHGEVDRPKYYIRRYKDSWGLHAEYYYIPGTFTACVNGRLDDDWFAEKDEERAMNARDN